MDRKFVFLLVVAFISISISAKGNQKKFKCEAICEGNEYCESWKFNEKSKRCKLTIKKGARSPRISLPCETATNCEEMYDSTMYESWKFNEKSKKCTITAKRVLGPIGPFPLVKLGCTEDVVGDICNPSVSIGIPNPVQYECVNIGLGLIQHYFCTHKIGDYYSPHQQTCCRDVVLNLCNGSPDVQYGPNNQTVREACIQNGYNDCLQKNCSINCALKVLKELCGSTFSSTLIICNNQANKIASAAEFKKLANCNGTETCKDAVNQFCNSPGLELLFPPASTSKDM